MNESPETRRLKRAAVWGVILALGGVVFFVVLWVGFASVDQVQRLIIALCVPPGVIALLVGGYFLLTQRQR
jgi:lipopolysaccharide export LptBFGC system permease protein LptF